MTLACLPLRLPHPESLTELCALAQALAWKTAFALPSLPPPFPSPRKQNSLYSMSVW